MFFNVHLHMKACMHTIPNPTNMSSETKTREPKPCHYGSISHGAKKGKPIDVQYWFLQEKIDGSQFTTWVQPDKDGTPLQFFCGTKKIGKGANMFNKAMGMMLSIHSTLTPGWTYHAECIQKLKHNVITYQRLPAMYNVVYDIQDENGLWLTPWRASVECMRVGLEYVYFDGSGPDQTFDGQDIREYASELKLGSSLLGDDVVPEGCVLKIMHKNGTYSKMKYVRKEFKEMQNKKQPKPNTMTPLRFCEWVGSLFRNAARVFKAIQHLKQQDVDLSEPNIRRELDRDLLKERSQTIYRYLVTEFTPIVMGHNQNRREEQAKTWADDPIYQSLMQIKASDNSNVDDQIYAFCLLEVLKHSKVGQS